MCGRCYDSAALLLFTRPGQLTIDFIERRRARQIPPLRLFLVFFAVYFFFAADAVSLQSLRESPLGRKTVTDLAATQGVSVDEYVAQNNHLFDTSVKLAWAGDVVVTAFGYWLLFRKRRAYLVEHLVMAAHLGCVSVTVKCASTILLPVMRYAWPAIVARTPSPFSLQIVAILVYSLFAGRRVYAEPWSTLLLKTVVIRSVAVAAWLLIAMVVAIAVLYL